ncbi:MAG TPA: hypothetical protein PKC72_10610 [Chitinophagaceae bacterium]|nr:hypothetical protein [Chitinophagaceae bacterium]
MGQIKKDADRSRRDFLSLFMGKQSEKIKAETTKMLTADGRLVEVDKSIVSAAKERHKATNKSIYDWMKNPSKKSK